MEEMVVFGSRYIRQLMTNAYACRTKTNVMAGLLRSKVTHACFSIGSGGLVVDKLVKMFCRVSKTPCISSELAEVEQPMSECVCVRVRVYISNRVCVCVNHHPH